MVAGNCMLRLLIYADYESSTFFETSATVEQIRQHNIREDTQSSSQIKFGF